MSTDPHPGSQPGPLDPIPVPPNPPGDEHAGQPDVDKVRFTRAAALWAAVIAGFLVLVVLLIFIAQNTASTEFAFLGWRWNLPLGVAILGAAVGGGLITALAGMVRIIQLRRAAKKNYKAALG
ncbi:uncharacterized integral membrane protein [Mycolicibacterium phlei]|uniref:Membrane protein n=1 Tax=Mycolicibacterium phlei DSM 43239 = CCUG 21000 TaxID=1226750 RepID=A0A5N5V5I3_MYCPH|nr:lipopolysaccharide assembly protein LapA domain-containing protein [Mycolicibacterium phlei]VEG07235.1 uncharacterized integral membrane protein [Mycobacteroides chelonae]AMO59103.1 hypothetical protein MPHLCCUG_00260 [Mycolicibacterium phlei]KAB7757184.1 membrane protein [Mycolicibacterium phlei DSM 43239 = CCUG 21000]KXW65027.1 membrane protein [Mycolicibacterium phlei DSM 43239 = CCUG 21000]KXW78918.1 membrane protein [Mycolicibacterium phlei DSM 43071]